MGERKRMFQQLDSLYTHLLEGASRQRELGAISQLDWLTMEAKRQQSRNDCRKPTASWTPPRPASRRCWKRISVHRFADITCWQPGRGIEASPYVDWLQRKEDLTRPHSAWSAETVADFTFNYFLGTNFRPTPSTIHGFEAGVALPCFLGQQAKIKASKLALASTQQLSAYEVDQLKTKQQELVKRRQLYKRGMVYFQRQGPAIAR
jgi:hypothetical protein